MQTNIDALVQILRNSITFRVLVVFTLFISLIVLIIFLSNEAIVFLFNRIRLYSVRKITRVQILSLLFKVIGSRNTLVHLKSFVVQTSNVSLNRRNIIIMHVKVLRSFPI